MYEGEDALPLQVRRTFRDENGDDPELAPSLTVNLEAASDKLASLGHSGIKQFEVVLEP